jgi:hypothetical protein
VAHSNRLKALVAATNIDIRAGTLAPPSQVNTLPRPLREYWLNQAGTNGKKKKKKKEEIYICSSLLRLIKMDHRHTRNGRNSQQVWTVEGQVLEFVSVRTS